jgi:hypothetical protein
VGVFPNLRVFSHIGDAPFCDKTSSKHTMKYTSILLFVFTIILGQSAVAQVSSESKVRVEFVNGYWLVDFKTDNQTAMKTLKTVDPAFDPSELGVEGVEKRYRAYLKKRFVLQVDTAVIEVKFVSAEMNSARTNAQFISARFKSPGEVVTIKSIAFSELEHHQQKLIFLIGEEKHVSWLSKDNDYSKVIELPEVSVELK